jgi:hypothetical protein
MLSGTFEKVNADRQRLSTELVKCKEYKDKLESQLSRLGDVQYLTSQAERFQTDRDHLEMELGNFRSLLAARDDRIKSLERDLEIFHRSIDIQAQYEGTLGSRTGNSLGAAAPSGRETIAMKSLYYELGKRQTDAHSLAISLASSNQELVALRDSLRDATEARSEALGDLERLRQHCAQLTQQSVKDKDELSIPLSLTEIPSPGEFRDAIASLSPEQQRFAKAFRAMQVCVGVGRARVAPAPTPAPAPAPAPPLLSLSLRSLASSSCTSSRSSSCSSTSPRTR